MRSDKPRWTRRADICRAPRLCSPGRKKRLPKRLRRSLNVDAKTRMRGWKKKRPLLPQSQTTGGAMGPLSLFLVIKAWRRRERSEGEKNEIRKNALRA